MVRPLIGCGSHVRPRRLGWMTRDAPGTANWPGFICLGWKGINLGCDIEGSCGLSTASGAVRHTGAASCYVRVLQPVG